MNPSTHRVEVVRIEEILSHDNADQLEIIPIWGFSCIVRKGDFQVGQLVAYIQPDSVVDSSRDEFKFLSTKKCKECDGTGNMVIHNDLDPLLGACPNCNGNGSVYKPENIRIRVARLRGIYSQGLLIPAPEKTTVGDDVAELLGVTHYEPPVQMNTGGETGPAPFFTPRMDIDSWYRYKEFFIEGEPVIITCKLHGASMRFTYYNHQMYVGSHNEWKREGSNLWWTALKQNSWIETWCKENNGFVLYGEVVGHVQSLHYGLDRGQYKVYIFDIYEKETNKFVDWPLGTPDTEPWVPLLYMGPYAHQVVLDHVDGPSAIPGADHIREGVVIKTVTERYVPELAMGRMQLKAKSNAFLEKH